MSNRSKWSRWRIAWGSWCLGTKIVVLPSQSLWVCEPGLIIFVGKNEGWWWRSCVRCAIYWEWWYDSACDDVCVFVGLAYQGKDIVFRFIMEYSSLMDFGPQVIIGRFLYEEFWKMIFWVVLKLEINYRVIISWRILVSFRGFFGKLCFCMMKYLSFHNPSFAFRCKWHGHVWYTPCFWWWVQNAHSSRSHAIVILTVEKKPARTLQRTQGYKTSSLTTTHWPNAGASCFGESQR